MENFDDLSLEEKIRLINEFGVKMAEVAKPIVELLVNAFRELGMAVAMATYPKEKFLAILERNARKERHRKRYLRMMERHK